MAITASGIGSGLDINGIVSQLMQLERRPVYLLENNNRTYDAQLSAYGRLRSAISSFESAMEELGSLDKFKVFSSTSSNEDALTVSADSNAAQGVYSMEVSRLAQNHKLGSDLINSDDLFTGTLTTVGTDLKDYVSGNSYEFDEQSEPGADFSIIFDQGGSYQDQDLESSDSCFGEWIAIANDTIAVANCGIKFKFPSTLEDGMTITATVQDPGQTAETFTGTLTTPK